MAGQIQTTRFRTETRTVTVAASQAQALLDASSRNRLLVVTVDAGAANPTIAPGRIGSAAAGFLLVDTTTPGIRLGAGEPLWCFAENIATFSVWATDLPEDA